MIVQITSTVISVLFFDITQRIVESSYQCFGTAYFFLDFLKIEDGTGRLSRNVGKVIPLRAAQYPRRAHISSTSRRKPDITHFYSSVLLAVEDVSLCMAK